MWWLEHYHVIIGHTRDRFLRQFLIFIRIVFRPFLQKLPDTPLPFGPAICLANFTRALKNTRPYLITSYETTKDLFLIFRYFFSNCFAICTLVVLLIGGQMQDPASTYFCNLKNFFFQNESAKPKFAICVSCLTVKRASLFIMDLILLMLDLVTANQVFLNKRHL